MKVEKRTLTLAEREEQIRDSTRIAPGIWLDRHQGLHFSIPELLAAVDLDDTPENRAIAYDVVRSFVERLGREDLAVIEQDLQDGLERPRG